MNEEVYYTIKKLIYKVMEDTDSFEVIGKGDCVFEYKRIGVKDNRNSFEILEDDFNRLWFKPVFNFIHEKILENETTQYIKSLQEQRKSRCDRYRDYLG